MKKPLAFLGGGGGGFSPFFVKKNTVETAAFYLPKSDYTIAEKSCLTFSQSSSLRGRGDGRLAGLRADLNASLACVRMCKKKASKPTSQHKCELCTS